MEDDKTWTNGEQKFHFAGCGGTLMDDIPRQLKKTGTSELIIGTIGGNNGFFGDIARACVYHPAPGPWGKDYDDDPDGKGECKKNLAKARDYIKNNLRDEFKKTIDGIFTFKQSNGQMVPRFDLYVSSYVEFFDATTDACDKWSFGRWFSTGYPKLVKPLRAEMNELVGAFNDVQAEVLKTYEEPSGYAYHAHHLPVSAEFKGHRFCEEGHSEKDQWTSAEVWIWNLQWNNGETSTDEGGPDQPKGAPDGPLQIMSLDTRDPNEQDRKMLADPVMSGVLAITGALLGAAGAAIGQAANGQNVSVTQSGFGWTARPFHPKPRGHVRMKEFFIDNFRKDGIPGIKPANAGTDGGSTTTKQPDPEPTSTTAPKPKPTACHCNESRCTADPPGADAGCCANGTCGPDVTSDENV